MKKFKILAFLAVTVMACGCSKPATNSALDQGASPAAPTAAEQAADEEQFRCLERVCGPARPPLTEARMQCVLSHGNGACTLAGGGGRP